MRVPDFLVEQRVPFETLAHAPAFSSQKLAKYLHVPGSQVAKCVLLAGPEDYTLAVLPSTHQVDTEVLAGDLGGPVHLASDQEIARVFNDCEWGVIVPFGTLYGLATVIDQSLNPDSMLIFDGHTHAQAIRMRCRDFIRLEQPVRLSFAFPAKNGNGQAAT